MESFPLTNAADGSCSGSVTKSLLNADGAAIPPDVVNIDAVVSGIWDEAGTPGSVERPQTISDTLTFTSLTPEL